MNSLTTLLAFSSDRKGATLIEFAMLGPPFIIMLISLMEIGLVHMAQSSFERQVSLATRVMKTGQAQAMGWDRDAMKAYVCDAFFTQGGCAAGIKIDVRAVGDVAQTTVLAGQDITNNGAFNIGGADDIILFRAELDYDPIIGFGDYSLVNGFSDQPFSFKAASVARNETF